MVVVLVAVCVGLLVPVYVGAKALWVAAKALERLTEALGVPSGASTAELSVEALLDAVESGDTLGELRLESEF